MSKIIERKRDVGKSSGDVGIFKIQSNVINEQSFFVLFCFIYVFFLQCDDRKSIPFPPPLAPPEEMESCYCKSSRPCGFCQEAERSEETVR